MNIGSPSIPVTLPLLVSFIGAWASGGVESASFGGKAPIQAFWAVFKAILQAVGRQLAGGGSRTRSDQENAVDSL